MVGSESPVKEFLELPDTGLGWHLSAFAAAAPAVPLHCVRWPRENAVV